MLKQLKYFQAVENELGVRLLQREIFLWGIANVSRIYDGY